MSETNKTLTVFLDNIGRTIIGNLAKEDSETLSIENPALVHVQPNVQSGQLQLQILPLFFKEFQADRNKPTVWNFKKANITTCDEIPFASPFSTQYDQLFQAPVAQKQPEVVKLFDDE